MHRWGGYSLFELFLAWTKKFLKLALEFNNSSMASKCPFAAARCKGVLSLIEEEMRSKYHNHKTTEDR
jgi:hypothetical protein